MRTLTNKPGFLNRHLVGMPPKDRLIGVVIKDIVDEQLELCQWQPFDASQYHPGRMPAEGFLGTATLVNGSKIGFHAWSQNDAEFVYYALIELPSLA